MDRRWWEGWVKRLTGAQRRPATGRQYARLSLRRLEDRRVLNAAAVVAPPTVQTTEDAKGAVVINAAPADDTPDVFSVVREEADGKDFLKVSYNGAVVFSQELDQVASVTIKGSGDQETLIVDFGDGNPIPVGGINFAGATDGSVSAAPDSILFVNGSADSVDYTLTGPTDGQVRVTTGMTASTVEFSGNVQTITDSLTAATRTFTVGGTIADVGLAAGTAAGTSQLAIGGGPQVTFADPDQALALDDATAAGLAISVSGLDAGFQADLTITGNQASDIQFAGAIAIGSGDLQVTGGAVSVDAEVRSLGGTIEISAYESVLVSQFGTLRSPGATIAVNAPKIEIDGTIAAVNGGNIRLDAGSQGTLLVSGRIDASSSDAGLSGGSVELLGARVGLTGNALVDVSGISGGGSVRIGGDWHGANPLVTNAQRTFVGAAVTIRADSLENGNGGTVVVWSDDVTGFYGTISAQGGPQGGAGGSVEVSSANELIYRGQTNLLAGAGATGTLLLDPLTITIVDQNGGADDNQLNPNVPNPGDPANSILFGDVPAANFTISESALEAANSNIVLQARNSIVVGPLTTDKVLRLPVNISITLQTRNNVSLGDSATGGISFADPTDTIQTQGTGKITMQAGATGSAADVSIGNLQTAGGSIVLTATRDITVGGNVTSFGGAISMTADADLTGTGTFSVSAGFGVATSGGALTISGADINLAGTLNSGAGTTTLQATNGRTIGVGDVANIGPAGAQFSLSGAELQKITAANLVVGSASNSFANGNITVDGVTAAEVANVSGTVTLQAIASGRTITFSGGATHFKALTALASEGVSVSTNLATTGTLTINGDSNSDGTGTFTIAGGQTVNSTGHSISITAADIDLAGALTSGAATTSLRATNNRTIGIGDIANIGPAGAQFALSGPELQQITAGNLIVGGATSGDLTVDAVTAAQVAGIAGAVTLQAPTAGRTITFSGGPSTFGTLNVNAASGINVNTNLTATGYLIVNADSDANGSGTFAVASGQTISSSGSPLSITAADLSLDGAVDSGAATTSLHATKGRTIGIGDVANIGPAAAQFALSGAELQNITAGSLNVGGANSGNITVDGVTAPQVAGIAGTVVLQTPTSGRTITFSGGASTFKTLLVLASDGVSVSSNLTTTGTLNIYADSNNNNLGTFTTTSGSSVNTTNHALTVTAADMALAGSLNSGTAVTTLMTSTLGRQIDLGTNTAGKFSLTDSELDLVTAETLRIGRNDGLASGQITVSAAISPAGTTNLHLLTGAGIGTSGAGAIVVGNLALSAKGPVSLLGANDVDALAAVVTGVNETLSFSDSDDLSVGTVDGVTGITTTNGDLLLDAGTTLTVNQAIDAGTGTVRLVAHGDVSQGVAGTITAGALGVRQESAAGGNITLLGNNDVNQFAAGNATSGGTIRFLDVDDLTIGSITASPDALFTATSGVTATDGDVEVTAGSLTISQAVGAGTGNVTLTTDDIAVNAGVTGQIVTVENRTAGRQIDFGTNTAGKLSLTDSELDLVTAETLRIGRNDGLASGQITVSAAVSPAGTTNLHLLTGAGIGTSGAGAIVVGNLALSAKGPVSLLGANDVDALAAVVTGVNETLSFSDSDDLSVGTVDGVTGITTTNGDLLLDAGTTLTVNQAIDAGTGTVRLVAHGDVTQGVAGTITAGALGVRQESAAGGNITLLGNNDVNQFAAGNATSGGTIRFLDVDDLTIGSITASPDALFTATSGVTATDGDVEVTAGSLTISQAVGAGTGNVTLTTDDIAVNAGVTGQIVTVENRTAGRQIDLGTNTAGKLSLTDSELDLVTAETLRIGRNDGLASGQITVSAAISPAGTTNLHLLTGAGIGTSGAGAIVVGNLALSAKGPVSLLGANDVDALAAVVTGVNETLSFSDSDDLSVGTVDGVTGITTTNGDLLLDAGTTLTVNQAIDAGTGTVRLVAHGDVSQGVVGTITAGALGVRQESAAGGNITLLGNNDVNRFAAGNAASGGTIRFFDINDVAIGSVDSTIGVTTVSGNIAIEAGANLFLNQAISASGALVSLRADAGAIADGNGAANNITSGSLVLRAAAGIGSGDAIETAVTTLAATNSTTGNVQIVNDVAGLLILGTVDGVAGIAESGGGFVLVTNQGPLTVNSGVTNDGGGDITLTSLPKAVGNDLTLNAIVYATGGNGNIHFNAGTDLVINDTGSAVDILTTGAGQILGIAENVVIIHSNVIIQTGVGSISTLVPALDNVKAPQLESSGKATVTGTFGDPGAHNFTVVVDWSDGTVDTYHFDDPGTFQFTHFYKANPDPTNAAAPIPILVTVHDDPNSTFIGLQQPPSTFPINATDFKTIANGQDAVLTFTNSPGEGLVSVGIFRLDTSVQIPQRLFPPLMMLLYTFDVSSVGSIGSSSLVEEAPTYLEARVDSRQALLVTVNTKGGESEPVVLDENVLDDLPGLFRRLPDGRYRLYLREVGEQRLRLLIDVNLRGGKPSDDTEGGQDKPPTAEVDTKEAALAAPSTVDDLAFRPVEFTISHAAAALAHDRDSTDSAGSITWTASGETIPAIAAVLAGIRQRSWDERRDEALGATGDDSLSTAARLARRVRGYSAAGI